MSNLGWTRNAALALIGLMGMGVAVDAAAQSMQFFRIGTGGTAGSYFPIGDLIANAISNPPGSRPCGSSRATRLPLRSATTWMPAPLRATR